MPVLPYGPGGLQRTTHARATSLLRLGHDVTLFAMEGSEFEGRLKPVSDYPSDFGVILDVSHHHVISQGFPKLAVLNLILDQECKYQPPNAVVETEYMKAKYPKARRINAGIDVDTMPFDTFAGDYLAFMGGKDSHKQLAVAEAVSKMTGVRLEVINTGFSHEEEALKWQMLCDAAALLCPYTIDAGPRAPLEAAACGTPTICLDGDGTKEHVFDGVSGFVCQGVDSMAKKVLEVDTLQSVQMRYWVKQMHAEMDAAERTERLLMKVANGERW